MFFEAHHSLKEKEFFVSEATDRTFPIHLHRSFEYFEQEDGVTEVRVGETTYTLHAGEAVLIFPLQPHAYQSRQTGKHRMVIFSPDMVADFSKKVEHMLPESSLFSCHLPQTLFSNSLYHQKAMAYFICGCFDQGRSYVEAPQKEMHQLLTALLLFVDRNFCTSCQLRDVAAKVGYEYSYASKYFKRKMGISFKSYVNSLRVIEAQRLLLHSSQSMERIAEACGFSSLRSFDRAFFAQTGMTPSEYRKQK